MKIDEYLQAAAATAPPLEVLGRVLHGILSWNVNDACNYRCSYCTQRFQRDRSHVLREFGPTLAVFGNLPGRWEIKLSGGEPFVQPRLPELVAGLVRQGHLISVQTNFSAPDALLQAFLAATRGALHLFSASLHLEYATAEEFLDRYRRLLAPYAQQHPGFRFHVSSVATPQTLPLLHGRIAPFFAREGILFKVQPEKDHGVVRPFTSAEQALLRELGGHNRTGAIAPCFQGRLCHAGSRYFVIKSNGQAYRCYAASRAAALAPPHTALPAVRLGSLEQGLTLLDGPRLCPYPHCVCTVPIQRGMIDGVPPERGGQGD